MGWARGAGFATAMIKTVQAFVPDGNARKAIYATLIDACEDEDCDTLDECTGVDPCFDMALIAAHPEDFVDVTEKDPPA